MAQNISPGATTHDDETGDLDALLEQFVNPQAWTQSASTSSDLNHLERPGSCSRVFSGSQGTVLSSQTTNDNISTPSPYRDSTAAPLLLQSDQPNLSSNQNSTGILQTGQPTTPRGTFGQLNAGFGLPIWSSPNVNNEGVPFNSIGAIPPNDMLLGANNNIIPSNGMQLGVYHNPSVTATNLEYTARSHPNSQDESQTALSLSRSQIETPRIPQILHLQIQSWNLLRQTNNEPVRLPNEDEYRSIQRVIHLDIALIRDGFQYALGFPFGQIASAPGMRNAASKLSEPEIIRLLLGFTDIDDINKRKRNALERFIQKQRAEKCVIKQSKSRGKPKLFKCPRPGCGAAYHKRESWIRHLMQYDAYEFWLCPVKKCEFIQTRRDRLITHLGEEHGGQNLSPKKVEYGARFRRRCGFCGEEFSDWKRLHRKHIAKHFLHGEYEMEDWHEDWLYRKEHPRGHNNRHDEQHDYGDDDDDDDDDDNDDDYDDYNDGGSQGPDGNNSTPEADDPENTGRDTNSKKRRRISRREKSQQSHSQQSQAVKSFTQSLDIISIDSRVTVFETVEYIQIDGLLHFTLVKSREWCLDEQSIDDKLRSISSWFNLDEIICNGSKEDLLGDVRGSMYQCETESWEAEQYPSFHALVNKRKNLFPYSEMYERPFFRRQLEQRNLDKCHAYGYSLRFYHAIISHRLPSVSGSMSESELTSLDELSDTITVGKNMILDERVPRRVVMERWNGASSPFVLNEPQTLNLCTA